MLTAFRVRKRLLDELEQPVGKVARKETAEEAHVSPAVPPPADVEPLAQPSAAPGDAALSSLGVRTPPGKTPPVRVETVIKRVYHLVHEVSFLDWGLTSEWALSADSTAGGRSRTRQHVQQQQQQAQPGAQLFPRRVGGDAGNAASEGYGEVTEGSLQHVLNYLAELRLRALDAPGDKGRAGARLTAAHDMGPESRLVDVGSGYGKVVFHAALSGLFQSVHGVEYVASRAALAAQVLGQLQAPSQKMITRLGGPSSAAAVARCMATVSLACGDATLERLHYSHVYMYDKVFNEATSAALARQLNASRFRVLVTFRQAASWRQLGLRHCVQVSSLVMKTTGGQSFRCYVLANMRQW